MTNASTDSGRMWDRVAIVCTKKALRRNEMSKKDIEIERLKKAWDGVYSKEKQGRKTIKDLQFQLQAKDALIKELRERVKHLESKNSSLCEIMEDCEECSNCILYDVY